MRQKNISAWGLFLLALLLMLTPTGVKAQEEQKVYEFSLVRYTGDYTKNLKLLLGSLGNGSDSWVVPAGGTVSFNQAIGCLEEGCGYGGETYRTVAGTPAAGACDVASWFFEVASAEGLKPEADRLDHPAISGVSAGHSVTIWRFADGSGSDLRINNPTDRDATFRWQVKGDVVIMWVTTDGEVTETTITNTPTDTSSTSTPTPNKPGGIVIALLALLCIAPIAVIIILVTRTDVSAKVLIGVVNTVPVVKSTFKEALKEALRWWFFLNTGAIIITPELRKIFAKGLLVWIGGETSIQNWQVVVLVAAFFVNVWLRQHYYEKKAVTGKNQVTIIKHQHGCFNQIIVTVVLVVSLGMFATVNRTVGATGRLIEVQSYLLTGIKDLVEDIKNLLPNPDLDPVDPPDATCPLPGVPERVNQWCDLFIITELDPYLVAAVIDVESDGDQNSISSDGAVGLMQVMPRDGVAANFACPNGPCFSGRPSIDELLDPAFNIEYGSNMLGSLISEKGIRDGLMAYGPAGVGYSYADEVLSVYESYQK